MIREKENEFKGSYSQPSCKVIELSRESLLTTVSGNLPDGSSGTDMGGGSDEEPITMPAKSFDFWDSGE